MRLLATGLLVLMLLVFVLTSMLQPRYPWLGYLRAFAEAATVGASADWFAVVALFRHPLGIPIPHTAIIARSKQRIGEALGRFICNNFLAPEVIAAKLDRFDAAAWGARWLAAPGNAARVARRSLAALPLLLDLLGTDRVHQFARQAIRGGIDSLAAAPLMARTLTVLVAHDHDQDLFDLGLEMGEKFLAQNPDILRQKVAERSGPWVPEWIDNRLADKMLAGLNNSLAEMHDPEHPYRKEFRGVVEKLIQRLNDDPVMVEQCERIKAQVLDSATVESHLVRLIDEIQRWVKADAAGDSSVIASGLERMLLTLSQWLAEHEQTRARLNGWLRDAIVGTVVPNRQEIGDFIAEEVARWDAKTVVNRAELLMGRDLQFIRINGTVVGGLVGVLIYVAQRFFG